MKTTSKVAGNGRKRGKKGAAKLNRQDRFINSYADNAFNASKTCREIGIAHSTYKKWLVDEKFVAKLSEAANSKIDEAEEKLFDHIRDGNVTAVIFFLKTIGKSRGYIEGSPIKTRDSVTAKATEILDGVIAGTTKPEEAGLLFDKIGLSIPEGLKILIQRSQPPEPDPCAGWNQSEIEKELDARYAEQMKRVAEEEKTWVPQRRAEVQALKNELKDADSFIPDAEIKKGDN